MIRKFPECREQKYNQRKAIPAANTEFLPLSLKPHSELNTSALPVIQISFVEYFSSPQKIKSRKPEAE